MTEFRDKILQTGHRGRGSGSSLSLQDVETAAFKDRAKRKVFYVNSNAPTGSPGGSFADGFTTLEEAVNYAPADSLILVAPTHVETITAAAGLVLDKAGLTILGFGNGNRRPQINFTTAVGADMDVTAAGVTIFNCRFTGGIDALTNPVHVAAADFTMIDCVTEDVTGQATDFIVTTAAADRMTLVRWEHRGSASAGPQTAISIVGGDQITIEDAWIYGNFSVAAIENVTTAATNLNIYGGAHRPCYIRTVNNADVAVTLVTTSTGNVGPHIYARLQQDAANVTEAFVGADMQFMQPLMIVNADGQRNLESNITASAG